MNITGADLLVKALRAEQVSTLFAYPSGQAIDMFDAFYGVEDIQVILPRHEQGLIHAADGYARSTGQTGVCLVTSGPGATNLVTGIATANYDSVPLVCITGQVPTGLIGNDSFQEVDIVGITRGICKYAVMVQKREELAVTLKEAFYIARTGKPGVVVVDLLKNIQQELGSSFYPDSISIRSYHPKAPFPAKQIQKAADLLEQAQRPLFLIGGGVFSSHAEQELTRLAEQIQIPIVTTIMGKGAIPTCHDLYVGNLGIHGCFAANSAISACDVLCSIGTRFNDRITGKIEDFAKDAQIIHIDIEPASISRNVAVDIPIVTDARQAILALLECTKSLKQTKPFKRTKWHEQIHAWKEEHPLLSHPAAPDSAVLTPQAIMEAINRTYQQAMIATDVGQNQLWATQFLNLGEHKKLLTSGGLGTMGYGLPAAIGAKLGNPSKDVIVITGDGGIQMNIQELATAVVQELPITICILNNGYLGNVRQWQEMFYHRQYSHTCLRYHKSCPASCNTPGSQCPPYTPDFIQLAHSYGAKGIRVTKPDAIQAALQAARQETKVPTLIEFLIEPEANVLPIVPPGQPLHHMILES